MRASGLSLTTLVAKERERDGRSDGGVSNNCFIGVNEWICKSSGFGKQFM